MNWPGVSVVVPVFQSTHSLALLVQRVDDVLRPLGPYEIILVDDGSDDATWKTIVSLASSRPYLKGVRLGRNFGQHSALVAGIREASMPVTVTIDDDLQNPPEEIPNLVDFLVNGRWDVVYGVPAHVESSLPRKMAGSITRRVVLRGLGVNAATDLSSFRVFWTRMRDAFSSDIGTNVSLDALLTWGASKFGSVRVRHDPRAQGTSNYGWGRLARFAIDTTTGYSVVPLQVASILGFLAAVFGFLVLVYVTVRPLISGDSVPGFPFLAATIAIFAGAQLLTLGIIGEYLARMHFRVMRRPTYVVSEKTG